jgi:hypothetical protein
MTWFEREKVVSIDPNLSPIDYLLARMRDPRIEENVRTRIAIALLPFTAPKLAVTYQASESDFATLLEERIKRHEARLNGGMNGTKLIEPPPPANGAVEIKRPLARTADRRFRRL